jgi:hypothetical protein
MSNPEVPYEDGMKIGLGYNRLTGAVLPSPAVQGPSITALQGAGGQQVSSDCVTIQDVESLHKSLGVSVEAGGSYLGVSASAKVDYVSSCDFSSFSTYVLVRVSVQNAFESLDSPAFSPDAVELLANNYPERFRQRFGDEYIAGVKTGGEYFAIYQLTSTSQEERESLSVDVHAAFNAGLSSAELNVKINNATAHTQSHLQVQIHVFRQGTISQADLNLEDIMKTARDFPPGVSGDRSFPYAVMLQSYDALKNPNDAFNFIETQNQQDVLADLARKRFEFLTLRDDFAYILKHIDDFQNADGSPVDRGAANAARLQVVAAINTMEQEAAACARNAGQCAFTQFDTGAFDKPGLKAGKKTHSTVPIFVGLTMTEAFALADQTGLNIVEHDVDGPDDPHPGQGWELMIVGETDEDGNVYPPHSWDQVEVTFQNPPPGSAVASGSDVALSAELAPGVV